MIKVTCVEYDMKDFLTSCVTKYCDLAKVDPKSLRKVDTPFITAPPEKEKSLDVSGEQVVKGGELQPIASSILMKILYAARMARHDLLRACNFLATKVTKWDKHCGKMLHRLVSYINSTLDQRLYAWVQMR